MARIIFLKKDVTGLLPDNFIQDEILVTVTGSNRLVIPEYGAFFEQDFELRDADTNDVISKDDYYFSDLYQEATQESGKAVWNIAIIRNPNINTNLKKLTINRAQKRFFWRLSKIFKVTVYWP